MVPSLALELAPEAGRVAAPGESGGEASVPTGNATAEEAETTSADGSRSGSDEPQPVKQ